MRKCFRLICIESDTLIYPGQVVRPRFLDCQKLSDILAKF